VVHLLHAGTSLSTHSDPGSEVRKSLGNAK
jgi:hypothetical protein